MKTYLQYISEMFPHSVCHKDEIGVFVEFTTGNYHYARCILTELIEEMIKDPGFAKEWKDLINNEADNHISRKIIEKYLETGDKKVLISPLVKDYKIIVHPERMVELRTGEAQSKIIPILLEEVR